MIFFKSNKYYVDEPKFKLKQNIKCVKNNVFSDIWFTWIDDKDIYGIFNVVESPTLNFIEFFGIIGVLQKFWGDIVIDSPGVIFDFLEKNGADLISNLMIF